ncbi:hypothetical protein SO802_007811 [Lithocarpus litseifolius]|uniref:DUF4220 domain-containing protein n=1 Tax=Lithocarpus litseifolius TaxID=425828 RepID=A0AAW2DT07_9ROSI
MSVGLWVWWVLINEYVVSLDALLLVCRGSDRWGSWWRRSIGSVGFGELVEGEKAGREFWRKRRQSIGVGWVFLETRRLTPLFPEHVRKLWTDWELRVLVLVSLTLQLSLLHFGSRRRYSVKTWLRGFLWLAYLVADSVATVALGVISNNKRNRNSCDCNDSQVQNELMAFWAPFLLLHLGGQDTITAYAVQDNELWLRHLLGLVVQSGVALYILLVLEGQLAVIFNYPNVSCWAYQVCRKDMGLEISKLSNPSDRIERSTCQNSCRIAFIYQKGLLKAL